MNSALSPVLPEKVQRALNHRADAAAKGCMLDRLIGVLRPKAARSQHLGAEWEQSVVCASAAAAEQYSRYVDS